MNLHDLAYFKGWFSQYVAEYFKHDEAYNQAISLKQEHTERVCQEIVMLGQALNLPAQDLLLAETMGLFHDIGRFEQCARYDTFNDSISENHSGLGLRELAKHHVLSRCSDMECALITKTIGYHNVRILPEVEDERILSFTQLLRDADKLDIWRLFIDYYQGRYGQTNATIVWGLPDDPACSDRIINALRSREMADTRDMATLSDYKLLQMSWLFDVNFEPTFRTVAKRRYMEQIAATLPQTREIGELVTMILGYLQDRQAAI